MAKITYLNKVKIQDIPVAEINKFTDANANEIKSVVNDLDDIKQNKLVEGDGIIIDDTDPLNPIITSTGGGATNLTTTHATTTVTINSDTGTDAVINGATTSLAGVVTNGTQSFAGAKTFTGNVLSANSITNELDTYTGTAKVTQIITCSLAEYNAIGTKNANTLYVII